MFLSTSNKAKQLLYSCYIQRVTAGEIKQGLEDAKALLAEVSPGFRLLVDFTHLESMDLETTPEIGRLMELIDRSGVGMIARVIPDPDKDIGMNILTAFHYPHRPQIFTFKSLAEAMRALSL